jgi:putative transposase
VEQIKKHSSKWIKTKDLHYSNFYWQTGYAGFSVSHFTMPKLIAYIKNQEEHHKKLVFEKELLYLLDNHQIEYNKTYLFSELT